ALPRAGRLLIEPTLDEESRTACHVVGQDDDTVTLVLRFQEGCERFGRLDDVAVAIDDEVLVESALLPCPLDRPAMPGHRRRSCVLLGCHLRHRFSSVLAATVLWLGGYGSPAC